MIPVDMILLALYIALLCLAAGYDVATLRIPNLINLGIVGFFLLRGAIDPLGFPWLVHLAAGFAMFLIGVMAFNSRLMGGGDVKLLAATALWTGLPELSAHLLLTALGGALFGLLMLAARRLVRPLLKGASLARAHWIPSSFAFGAAVPYAVPIAASAIFVAVAQVSGQGRP